MAGTVDNVVGVCSESDIESDRCNGGTACCGGVSGSRRNIDASLFVDYDDNDVYVDDDVYVDNDVYVDVFDIFDDVIVLRFFVDVIDISVFYVFFIVKFDNYFVFVNFFIYV